MNRLKELRKEKGLTQQELADEMQTTKLTISNWENGKHALKTDKAQQLADFFGVSVGYLLGYEKSKLTGKIPKKLKELSYDDFIKWYFTDEVFDEVEDDVFKSMMRIKKREKIEYINNFIEKLEPTSDDLELIYELVKRLSE